MILEFSVLSAISFANKVPSPPVPPVITYTPLSFHIGLISSSGSNSEIVSMYLSPSLYRMFPLYANSFSLSRISAIFVSLVIPMLCAKNRFGLSRHAVFNSAPSATFNSLNDLLL